MSDRIKELTAKLSRYENAGKQEVQTSFLEGSYQSEIELTSREQEQKISELKFQISQIDHEIHQLGKHNLPFIWRIDFPEIFMQKGGFDIVIGNPPYLAQEHISDPLGKIGKSAYKGLLKKMTNQDFPIDIPEISISGKSDLYTFFYIRGLKILNDAGILCYICSNSWLDVAFGAWLQKLLLERCPIHFIIDNLGNRAFKNADVNTIISVIGAPQKMVRGDDKIRFVAFKLPFEESLYTENFITIEETESRKEYDDLRINSIDRDKLVKEGWENSDKDKYNGSMWGGFHLRAPHILIRILENCHSKLCLLNEIAQIRGYIHDNNVGDQHPKQLFVKSVKDISVLGVDRNTEGVKTAGIRFSKMNDLCAPILFPRTLGSRHLVLRNLDNVYYKEFYKVIPNIPEMADSIFAQLNSSFCILQREIIGLSNLGDGAIKFSIQSIGLFRLIRQLSSLELSEVIPFLLTEPVDDIKDELSKSYRMHLDDIVFSKLGLDRNERKQFMDILHLTVEQRLSRASKKAR